jgi:hypothetical protein
MLCECSVGGMVSFVGRVGEAGESGERDDALRTDENRRESPPSS